MEQTRNRQREQALPECLCPKSELRFVAVLRSEGGQLAGGTHRSLYTASGWQYAPNFVAGRASVASSHGLNYLISALNTGAVDSVKNIHPNANH